MLNFHLSPYSKLSALEIELAILPMRQKQNCIQGQDLPMNVHIDQLNTENKEQIETIAHWYFEEWNTPIEKTLSRLRNYPSNDVLVQLVATDKNHLLATAGLANTVNLVRKHNRFSALKPWVALLYTQEQYRQQGIGKLLLEGIEEHARSLQLSKIYLYTFTAEALYAKCGWTAIASVNYKGHETVVMEKTLSSKLKKSN